MLIRMHLKYIIQAFLYKYSFYLSRKIPTSWQCLHTMLNPTSRAHALWVISHLKTLVLLAVTEDEVSHEKNFCGIQQCTTFPSYFLQHKEVVCFCQFFFSLPGLCLQNIFGEGTKGFAPIPSIWIKYLCYTLFKHFHLVTCGMWSPDLNTQAHLNQLPFELHYRLEGIFIHSYYRHMKTLWCICGTLQCKAGHALVQSHSNMLCKRAILWFLKVHGTIWCRASPKAGRMMIMVSAHWPAITIQICFVQTIPKWWGLGNAKGIHSPTSHWMAPAACSQCSNSEFRETRLLLLSSWKSFPFLKDSKKISFCIVFEVPINVLRIEVMLQLRVPEKKREIKHYGWTPPADFPKASHEPTHC